MLFSAGMTEDTIPSEVVAVEMGISNSEPIFCDVNNGKILDDSFNFS